MSFYYINYLSFKKNGDVNVRAADSSIRPLYYRTLKHMNLVEEGKTKEQYLQTFAISVRDGNYHISGSSCKILVVIRNAIRFLQEEFKFGRLLKDEDYGKFVAMYTVNAEVAIEQFQKNLKTFLSIDYIKETLLEDSGRWERLPEEYKQLKSLAEYYVEACADTTFFCYPEALILNKEYILKAVQARGVNFRAFHAIWGNDKEVVFTAFSNPSWTEHLPDLIDLELLEDKEFICSIIEAEPKLHWERFPRNLREDPVIVNHLRSYNVWFQAKERKNIA